MRKTANQLFETARSGVPYGHAFEYNRKEYSRDEQNNDESYWQASGHYMGDSYCTFNIYGPYKGRTVSGYITCRIDMHQSYTVFFEQDFTERQMHIFCTKFVSYCMNEYSFHL